MGTEGWELGGVPSAAESLDEEHAGIHLPPENIDGIPFVCQFDGLRRDDLQVGVHSSFITIRKKMQGILCRCDGLILLLCFVLENAQCGERLSSTSWKAVSEVWRYVATVAS